MVSSDERTLETIARSLRQIELTWPQYNARRLDYRGGYPANSMPEHVSGSGEPAMLEQDDLQRKVAEGWVAIKAALEQARVALRGVESEMAFVVNTTKRPEDPPIKVCANPHCPDARVFTMMGEDRPHDAQGRCDACRKFWGRNQRERTSKNAYALQTETEMSA